MTQFPGPNVIVPSPVNDLQCGKCGGMDWRMQVVGNNKKLTAYAIVCRGCAFVLRIVDNELMIPTAAKQLIQGRSPREMEKIFNEIERKTGGEING